MMRLCPSALHPSHNVVVLVDIQHDWLCRFDTYVHYFIVFSTSQLSDVMGRQYTVYLCRQGRRGKTPGTIYVLSFHPNQRTSCFGP